MNLLCALIITLICVQVSLLGAQHAKEQPRPLLYNDISGGSPTLNRESEKAYAGKFRIIETTPKEGFSPGGVKGFQHSFRDPRSMRDYAIPGEIAFAFIVTPDGRTIEPRVLHCSDKRVSDYILNRVALERYFPARFRGKPVYSIYGDEIKFGGHSARENEMFRNGLGVQGYRDR